MTNEDMPWVLGLTDEEVQELRSKKQELTQYGKEKLRELMNNESTLDEMLEIAAQREKENQEALETLGIDYENFGQKPWDESMLEEVELTEKENQVLDIAKNLMEENKEAFQHLAAIERKELAEKDFEDLTREQKIQLALEEIDWIVIGGQDGNEYYNSIQFLRKVLRSLL